MALEARDAAPASVCQWCPIHEVAWIAKPYYGPPCWHPLPRSMLRLALRMARWAQCTDQIRVEVTPCAQCRAGQHPS